MNVMRDKVSVRLKIAQRCGCETLAQLRPHLFVILCCTWRCHCNSPVPKKASTGLDIWYLQKFNYERPMRLELQASEPKRRTAFLRSTTSLLSLSAVFSAGSTTRLGCSAARRASSSP